MVNLNMFLNAAVMDFDIHLFSGLDSHLILAVITDTL